MAHTNQKTLEKDIKRKQFGFCSQFYSNLYLEMGKLVLVSVTLLSVIAIVVSVGQGCPTPWFVQIHIASCPPWAAHVAKKCSLVRKKSHNHGRTIPVFIRKLKQKPKFSFHNFFLVRTQIKMVF